MDTHRRVAITGIGMVTPVGNDVETTWDALLTGRSGLRRITLFDASGFPVRIAAEVKGFRAEDVDVPRKTLKLTNRSHRFALAAAEQALRDAGIRPTPDTAARWCCAVGAGDDDERLRRTRRDPRPQRARRASSTRASCSPIPAANDPLVFCRSQASAGLALVTSCFDIRGYATAVHTACASGGQALGTALKLIRRGSADYALAGGFDSMVSPIGISGFVPPLRAVDRQRHAGAREPSVRPHAQRLRAGRRRGLPRARGMGSGAPARRAHLCGARGRRQFALVAIGSPTRRQTATARSRRCAPRSPTRAPRRRTSIT